MGNRCGDGGRQEGRDADADKVSLRERVKELNCLYSISIMLVDERLNLADALERIVTSIPSGFSSPEHTGAIIRFGESSYTFNASGTVVADEPIVVHGAVAGTLSVVVERDGDSDTARVLPEERRLLKAVAELSASIITRIQADDSLRLAAEELRDKNCALREILFQVEAEQNRFRGAIVELLEERLVGRLEELRSMSEDEIREYVSDLQSSLRGIVPENPRRHRELPATLSPREHEVCLLIRRGLASKEIARKLHISSMTVEKHRRAIRKKLGLTNTTTNLAVYLKDG
jgi:DNA-binding NarL/FixJ family response regulator